MTCPSVWKTSNLDEILLKGDKMYQRIDTHHKHQYLLLGDIPSNVAVFAEPFHGLINGKTDTPFYSLNDAVNELLSMHESCLFTMGTSEPCYTSAIFKCEEQYYFFDSHSRNDVGMLSPEGKACVTIHTNTENLCVFIRNLAATLNLKGNVPFEIAAFKDTRGSVSLENSSDSDTESDFSGFEPISEGEYSCRLFLAEEAIKTCRNI